MMSKALSYGWKVMLVLGIFYLFSGLVYVAAVPMTFIPGFEAFTGQSWTSLSTSSPRLAELYVMYLRWAGVVFLAVGVAVCSLSLRPYRKGEKWSWYSLFIVGILPLIGTTIFDWQMGEMAGTAFALIGWILFIIAIGSPAKAILGKKPL